ncbi:MAG TPA: DUF1573 domain-containing protein [Chitinophagaceae bacterium]|nr:DUF1573 domain-containing protein [Chitinophagaceae bacterium]
MKKFLLIISIAAGLVACQGSDQKAGKPLSQEEKDKAVNDSSNFTTIQWLDSTVKELGKVKEGQVVEVSYRFKNTGDRNLIIQNVSASCGCTVPEKPDKPFAPGEEGTVRAKFDSKGRPHGEARKEVYVNANTKPEQQHILTFKVEITD